MKKLMERTGGLVSVIYWLTSQEPLAFLRFCSTAPRGPLPRPHFPERGLRPLRPSVPVSRPRWLIQRQHLFRYPGAWASPLSRSLKRGWEALHQKGSGELSHLPAVTEPLWLSLCLPGKWERIVSSSQSWRGDALGFAQGCALSKGSTDVVNLVPKSQLCDWFYVTFPDLGFLSCEVRAVDRNKPCGFFQLWTSWCRNKMDAVLFQLSPGGRLCQKVAPLIHVSSKLEGCPLVNLCSALKRSPKTQLFSSCL